MNRNITPPLRFHVLMERLLVPSSRRSMFHNIEGPSEFVIDAEEENDEKEDDSS